MLLGVLAVGEEARAQTVTGVLVMQVRTDATPEVHFDAIRTEVFREGSPVMVASGHHAADPARDYGRGVRVYEIELGISAAGVDFGREFTGTTALMLGGGVARQRPWRVAIEPGGITVVTILLPFSFEPVEQVSKVISLHQDEDLSGNVSPCDVLEYTIEFTTTHELSRGILVDDPRPSATLIPGSVRTTHGRVFRGNLAGHATVVVRYGSVPSDQVVTVTYLVKVPPVSNQASLTLEVAGTTARYDLVTDDPLTDEPNDPTVMPDCRAGDQIPSPGGIITELPPPPTPLEVVTEFDDEVGEYVADTLVTAQELIDEALSEHEENPKEAEPIGDHLEMELGHLVSDSSMTLELRRDLALQEAKAAGADKHQLDRIQKAAKFGKKMIKEIMKRLDDRFGASVDD